MKHLVILLLFAGPFLAQDQPEHPREKPTMACFPVKADKTPGCMCMKDETRVVCKDGKRMEETHRCASYCWVEMCACCLS